MKKWSVSAGVASVLIVGLFFVLRPRPRVQSPDAATISRSRLSTGNAARLQRAMDKARRGEPIAVGFIGGSITHGQGATSPDRCFAALVHRWWVDHFPKSKVTFINAGLNGTGSTYGVFRLQRDLLGYHPDFVVVEFGVNDHGDLAHAETYEGIIRQLMLDPDQPAILLLFLMHHDGSSAQDFQGEIGRQYDLPMVSYRDALWPEISAGRLNWSDISIDVIHPNDRGHAAAALYINSLLQQTLDHLPEKIPPAALAIPPPRYTDLFARTELMEARRLHPTFNSGWTYDDHNRCWFSDMPGSVIEFETSGKAIDLLYARVTPRGGTVQVTVDDQPTKVCDAWFDGTWEGFCQSDEVARELQGELHRVRVQLIGTRNPLSTGYDFRIMGLGVAK